MVPSTSLQIVFALLPKCTSIISIISSIYTIYLTLFRQRGQQKRSKLYPRTLCAMSVIQTLQSMMKFWGTWAVPEGILYIWGAKGSESTCLIQGFLIPYTNSVIMLYYLFLSVICYCVMEKKEKKITHLELQIHIVILSLPLILSVGVAYAGAIKPSYSFCTIQNCMNSKQIESCDYNRLIVALKGFFDIVSFCITVVVFTKVPRLMSTKLKKHQHAGEISENSVELRMLRRKTKLVQRQIYLLVTILFGIYTPSLVTRLFFKEKYGSVVNIAVSMFVITVKSLEGCFILFYYCIYKLGLVPVQIDELKNMNCFARTFVRLRLYLGSDSENFTEKPCLSIFELASNNMDARNHQIISYESSVIQLSDIQTINHESNNVEILDVTNAEDLVHIEEEIQQAEFIGDTTLYGP